MQVDTTSKQVLPKRSSAIDFVGYVEAVLGHAGEYPTCVIRESQPDAVEKNADAGQERAERRPRGPLAFPSAGFAADAFLSDLDGSDLEDTIPLPAVGVASLGRREPRVALTAAEADEILFGAEITAPRSSIDEIAVEDILEEAFIEPASPPPSSVRAVAIVTPLHAGFRPSDLLALSATPPSASVKTTREPSPYALPVLQRTEARRGGRGRLVVGLALLLVASAGIAAVASSGSASVATAWVSERAAGVHDLVLPAGPTTTTALTMEGQWTAPAKTAAPETPRAKSPAAENKAPAVPVVTFESLPRAR